MATYLLSPSHLLSPLRPFTWDAWLLIFFTTFVVGYVKTWVFDPHGPNPARLNHARAKAKKRIHRAEFMLKHEVYDSLMELVGGGIFQPQVNNQQSAPRILNIGFGIFILVFTASYTANLAAILQQTQIGEMHISSMQDCIDLRCSVCVHSVVYSSALDQYGDSGIHIIDIGSSGYMYDVSIQNKCDTFLIADITYQQTFFAGAPYNEIKEWFFVGEPIVWVPNSQPISENYIHAINFWQRKLVKDGTYQKGEDLWNPKVPEEVNPHSTFIDTEKLSGMTVTHFSGPSLLCLLCVGTALILDHWRRTYSVAAKLASDAAEATVEATQHAAHLATEAAVTVSTETGKNVKRISSGIVDMVWVGMPEDEEQEGQRQGNGEADFPPMTAGRIAEEPVTDTAAARRRPLAKPRHIHDHPAGGRRAKDMGAGATEV